jgi:hypothetical protein
MFIRPKEFVVDPNGDPFENDRLDRKKHIINLSNLLETTETPLVMTISAPWGGGKSSFIRMWKSYLEKEKGCQCILFDAWENDYYKDSMLSVVEALGGFAKTKGKKVKERFVKVLDRIQPLAKLASTAVGMAGTCSPECGAAGAVAGAADGLIGVMKEMLAGGCKSQKEQHEAFKKSLAAFAKEVSSGKPMYLFIDELDRCRPEYSIQLLESIKHFFSVEGIIFVISVDKKRLADMVRVRYGGGYDEDGYLKRFIDLDYLLPEATFEEYVNSFLSVRLRIREFRNFRDDKSYAQLLNFVLRITSSLGMTARDVEKVMIKTAPCLRDSYNYVHEFGNWLIDKGLINTQLHKYFKRYYKDNEDNWYQYIVFIMCLREKSGVAFEMLLSDVVACHKKYSSVYNIPEMWNSLLGLHSSISINDYSKLESLYSRSHEIDPTGLVYLSELLGATGAGKEVFDRIVRRVAAYDGVSFLSERNGV